MSLPLARSDRNAIGHGTPPGVPYSIPLHDTEGGFREVIRRNRWRYVQHERKKRDGIKLGWQLKEKLAVVWPEVRDFLGIHYFVHLIRGHFGGLRV